MAQGTIQSYRLTHTVGGVTSMTIRIAVTGADGRISYVDTMFNELAATEAAYIVDLMRNERPVQFNTDTSVISTVQERAGEGEGLI